jgi:ketosteroid isomerase-like protein
MALHQASMSKVLTDLSDPGSHANIAVVKGLYTALAAGSFASMAAFLTDDVEFELHELKGML